MNLGDLRDALVSNGIDPEHYHLNGASDQTGYHFVEGYGRWTVFFQDATVRHFEKSFFDEAAACDYLLQLATAAK